MAILEQAGGKASDPIPTGFGPSQESRMLSLRMLSNTLGALTGLSALGLVILSSRQPLWQLYVLAGLYGMTAAACAAAGRWLYPRGRLNLGMAITSLTLMLAMAGTAAFLQGLGIACAVVFLIYTLIVSSLARTSMQTNLLIWHGIITAGTAALLADFSPFEQLSIKLIHTMTPAILAVLFMIAAVLLAMQFVTASLRVRLVTVFMAIVIIPLAILSLIQSQFMFSILTNEVYGALDLAAQQTAYGVDRFLDEKQKTILNATQLDVFGRYLALPPEERADSPEEQEMRLTLRIMDTNEANNTIYISSFALLDRSGMTMYDTLSDRIAGQFSPETLRGLGINVDAILQGEQVDESSEKHFQVPATTGGTYVSSLQITSSSRSHFYISAPVRSKSGDVIGVIRARYDGLMLQDLLRSYSGLLGKNSYAVLLDEYNVRLADAYTPNFLYKAVAPLALGTIDELKASQRLPDLPVTMLSTDHAEFAEALAAYDPASPVFMARVSPTANANEEQIGAISTVRSMPWKIVYLRTDYSDEALRQEQRQLSSLVTVLIAVLVGMAAVGIAQLLSGPIIRLTRTAQEISQGNLEARAPAASADEYGMLGAAFNSMTSQLRGLIASLEDRVRVRTQEIEVQNQTLASRARQLQTVSEVARQIVSAQELEGLLNTVTNLISQRFGFYHVGVFLLDEKREFALLRAANSEGGQRMLARGHKLPVKKVGMVGYATGYGEARIATDVGAEAIYFNNPDLPATRSEMALPLKVGSQVIGALDIQSDQPNAFKEEDIELFSTLADQVAIAIYNNQLYIQTLEALDEAQAVLRQYLRSEWAKDTSQRKTLGYLFNQAGISAQQNESPLWKKVFNSGEPVYAVLPGSNGHNENAVMAVPIAVRGETIGVIHVQDQGDDRMWSEDEIAVVNSIASQVAVALENARLFENTVRRAEREKKVMEITAKIRATNDPEEMMRIAINELQDSLRATRTQIYIRQDEAEEGPKPASTNGNGRSHTP